MHSWNYWFLIRYFITTTCFEFSFFQSYLGIKWCWVMCLETTFVFSALFFIVTGADDTFWLMTLDDCFITTPCVDCCFFFHSYLGYNLISHIEELDYCEMSSLSGLYLQSNLLTEDTIHSQAFTCLTALSELWVQFWVCLTIVEIPLRNSSCCKRFCICLSSSSIISKSGVGH